MAKTKQVTNEEVKTEEQATPVETKQTQATKLAELLKKVGVTLTDEQLATISPYVNVKNPRKDDVKYTLGNVELTATDKVPQQMRIIVENLHKPMSLADWAAEVGKDERFTSKQDIAKVIAYYRKPMLDKNLIAITE